MATNNIQKRLYDIEATPPADMWSRIAEKLPEEKKAPVVVMSAPKNNWLKIALAASVLGFVITTALWLTKKPSQTTSPGNAGTAVAPTPTIIKDTIYLPKPETAVPNTAAPSIATTIHTQVQPSAVNTVIPNNGSSNKNSRVNNNSTKDNSNDINNTNQSPVLVDNNKQKDIIIKDGNGNPVRNIEVTKTLDPNKGIAGPDSKGDKTIGNILSKISLASDGEEIDSIINNSKFWKQQIKDWRNKLIKSGYTPNLINSLDFIELKKLLEKE